MIRVKDLFRLQGVRSLRLIAGQTGLDRSVRAAVLFEYDASRIGLADYYQGDLVVTTLAYARQDPELVTQSLLMLIRQGVAGLLVKTGYYGALPSGVTEAADREGIPVFLFDDTYIEEAILEITELIRGGQRFPGYEHDLDELMRGSLSDDHVRVRVRRMDPYGDGPTRAYALDPADGGTGVAERLSRLPAEELARERCVFMDWRRMLLALAHPSEEDLRDPDEFSQIDRLLSGAGVARDEVRLGCSALCASAEATGTALNEAVYAVRAAKAGGVPRLPSSRMGLYGYLMPMSENRYIRDHCRRQMEILRAYDRRNHASMEQTARECVRQGMEIAPAAKALFQHPNTVRYRLSKIRSLLEIGEDEPFELLLELAVRLSDLMETGE